MKLSCETETLERWAEAVALALLVFPTLPLADLTGTILLQSNSALDTDNGVTSTSGADIGWKRAIPAGT